MDLDGKVAVVTGGASGIGLATAQLLAAKGARVVVADVNEAAITQAVDSIAAAGGSAVGQSCDVRNEAQVSALMDAAVTRWGRLDVCVANAGILRDGTLLKVDKETRKVVAKMPLRHWQDVIDVNLTGVFLTGREAAVRMVDLNHGGVLILMSSISRVGNFGQTNYSAAKAGVSAMAVTWSRELARQGIRVNAIAPGFIRTPMLGKDIKPEVLERFHAMIPIGRLGTPEEVAQTVAFAIECDLVTGVCLEATGGVRM